MIYDSPMIVPKNIMPQQKNEFFVVAVLVMALGFFVGFMPLPQDPDLWFHLADGEYILSQGHVPQTDPFSFTRNGDLWMPHSWLFDVCATLSWHHLGPRSTEAIMGMCFMSILIICFHLLSRRAVPPVAALGICFFVALAAGNTRGVRPQVFSLLFTAICLALITKHKSMPSWRVLWTLPPIFLLWAQMHSGCVMGFIVIAVYLFGRSLDALKRNSTTASSELKPLAAALLASSMVILITPHAISHYAYVRMTMAMSFLKSSVVEWQPPIAFPLAVPDVYLFMLIGGVLVILWRYNTKVSLAELGVCGALIALACTATRHIPLACVGSIPLLAAAWGKGESPHVVNFSMKRQAMVVPACFVVALLVCLWRFPNDIWSRYAQAEPVIGARALVNLNQPLRVFTTYNTGPYVLWSKPGTLQNFVDSRADVFGDALLRQAEHARAGRGWQALFAYWSVQAAVVEKTDPIAEQLQMADDWQLLAEDHQEYTFILRPANHTGIVPRPDDFHHRLLTSANTIFNCHGSPNRCLAGIPGI